MFVCVDTNKGEEGEVCLYRQTKAKRIIKLLNYQIDNFLPYQ